jgi:hypothetical protein
MDTITHDAAVGYRAAGSAQIEITRTGGSDDMSIISQNVGSLTAGDRVRARVYVARTATFDETGDSVVLELQANVTTVRSVELAGDDVALATGRSWTVLEAETVVAPGQTSVTLQVIVNYAGSPNLDIASLYVDDVQFFKVGVAPTDISTTGLTVGQGDEVTKILSEVASLNFASISDNTTQELTITVTGAASGDTAIATPASGIEAGLTWGAYVSAADTVTVRIAYQTGLGGSIDPAARNWRATVFKF